MKAAPELLHSRRSSVTWPPFFMEGLCAAFGLEHSCCLRLGWSLLASNALWKAAIPMYPSLTLESCRRKVHCESRRGSDIRSATCGTAGSVSRLEKRRYGLARPSLPIPAIRMVVRTLRRAPCPAKPQPGVVEALLHPQAGARAHAAVAACASAQGAGGTASPAAVRSAMVGEIVG